MDLTRSVRILRYVGEKSNVVDDIVVKEYPLTIFLNDEELVTLLCSPKALDFLVYGFLISEGIIQYKKDLIDIKVDEEKGVIDVFTSQQKDMTSYFMGKRMMTTGCGGGTVFYNIHDVINCRPAEDGLKVDGSKLLALMREFSAASEIFQNTGGVHSAALSDGNKILVYHEDVGRHNALDKVLGEAFIKDILFTDKIILTSGRISSEMLTKAAKRGISIVVSRSAPMDLALRIGEAMNITIVGFVRGNRMNVYTGSSRIDFGDNKI
ncbi:MAG: sufurtransferase FdhD [Clostridiales bacterium GWB2_37_7]|nr:MAG: sufurtransferase FdhD [Clostridiales bacterium GWB2_37_7]